MGLTRIRAEQISDIDYKQAVRVVQTTNITLAGGAPNSVDGVNLSANDRVLVTGQNTGSQNGLYRVQTLGTGSNGTWIRSSDANADGEIEAGMIVMVTEGEVYKDTQWKLTTNDPIVIGVTALTFVLNAVSIIGGSTTQVQYNSGGVLAGSPNLTFDGSNLSVGGSIVPTANLVYSLGNATNQWANIYVGGNTIFLGELQLKDSGANTLVVYTADGTTPATVDATVDAANVIGTVANATYALTANASSYAGTVTTAAQPNITSLGNLSLLTVGGNINCGNIIATGIIQGSTIDSVNADLAERYIADAEYPSGTVMIFGGDQEITQSSCYADPRVAGIISAAPAYIMNSDSIGQAVALQGRVPCRVIGIIHKGDLVTSSNHPGVATRLDPQDWVPGSVIGKSLDNHDSSDEGIIEVVVGRV